MGARLLEHNSYPASVGTMVVEALVDRMQNPLAHFHPLVPLRRKCGICTVSFPVEQQTVAERILEGTVEVD